MSLWLDTMLSLRGASNLARIPLRPSTCSSRYISNISQRTVKQSHPTSLVPRKPVNASLSLYKPLSTSIQRYADSPGISTVELKHEQELAHRKLRPHPDQVSTTSSVHQVFHEKGEQIKEEADPDMLAGVWSDLVSTCVYHTGKDKQLLTEQRRESSRIHLRCMKSREKPSSSAWPVFYPTSAHPSPRRFSLGISTTRQPMVPACYFLRRVLKYC